MYRLPKRAKLSGLSIISVAFASGQAPDVQIKGDISWSLVSERGHPAAGRLITPLGRYSTVTLSTITPIGLNIRLSQRFATRQGDADDELFDEYYVEDPGSWRIGKQYIPFGTGQFFREAVVAARVDSALILEGVPLSLAVVDNGAGRQSGIVGRLGSSGLGFSAALGSHWAINDSAFAAAKPFQTGPGRESGYRQAIGIDWSRRFGKLTARYESVSLSRPNSNLSEETYSDFLTTYDLGHRHSIAFGFAGISDGSDPLLRFMGTYNARKGVSLEGIVRSQGGAFIDSAITLRVRF